MSETEPTHINILSDEDKLGYWKLRNYVSGPGCRNCRNKRLDNFGEMLNAIYDFCNKSKEDAWKRCQVCGICWFKDGIAVNSRQFSFLLGKCKSSINGSFHRLQFMHFPCSAETSKELIEFIPTLQTNSCELKQWTMRRQVVLTPQPTLHFEHNSFSLANEQKNKETNEHKKSNDDDCKEYKEEAIEQEAHLGFFEDPFSTPMEEWIEDQSEANDIIF